jgi:hypothetical protein
VFIRGFDVYLEKSWNVLLARRSLALDEHAPDYNQSLSSFPDAASTWYYVSSPMFTSR